MTIVFLCCSFKVQYTKIGHVFVAFQLFQNENDVLSSHVFPVATVEYGSAIGQMQNISSLRCMAGVLLTYAILINALLAD